MRVTLPLNHTPTLLMKPTSHQLLSLEVDLGAHPRPKLFYSRFRVGTAQLQLGITATKNKFTMSQKNAPPKKAQSVPERKQRLKQTGDVITPDTKQMPPPLPPGIRSVGRKAVIHSAPTTPMTFNPVPPFSSLSTEGRASFSYNKQKSEESPKVSGEQAKVRLIRTLPQGRRDQSSGSGTTAYHLQRALPGGIVLMELAFQGSYFCVKQYALECSRIPMGQTVNSQRTGVSSQSAPPMPSMLPWRKTQLRQSEWLTPDVPAPPDPILSELPQGHVTQRHVGSSPPHAELRPSCFLLLIWFWAETTVQRLGGGVDLTMMCVQWHHPLTPPSVECGSAHAWPPSHLISSLHQGSLLTKPRSRPYAEATSVSDSAVCPSIPWGGACPSKSGFTPLNHPPLSSPALYPIPPPSFLLPPSSVLSLSPALGRSKNLDYAGCGDAVTLPILNAACKAAVRSRLIPHIIPHTEPHVNMTLKSVGGGGDAFTKSELLMLTTSRSLANAFSGVTSRKTRGTGIRGPNSQPISRSTYPKPSPCRALNRLSPAFTSFPGVDPIHASITFPPLLQPDGRTDGLSKQTKCSLLSRK
ncbi:hypothetical protein JZ751_019038 [Albula glossodonta]|uniref:Uncharacterized protein n=1 Tax=Albula glossodonta TaxID=121402 RepID=A0A8T2NL88_9TELE|nr:hypothetical protein JZ751_019038 [Albula glossodonta]